MPATSSELELRIQWLDRGVYFVGGKFIDTKKDSEYDILDPVRIHIDIEALREHTLKEDDYGAALAAMVFGEEGSPILAALRRARTAAADCDGLRIRLHIQNNAPELHAVRWELLREPGANAPLLADPKIWFSRFLSADEFRLRPLRNPDTVQVLVVVSDPDDLATRWKQPAIDATREFERARDAITARQVPGGHHIAVRRLAKRATIYNIVSEMRENYADVIYLACHGMLTDDGGPRLLLENEDGLGEMVKGEQLVERLSGSQERPRMVILASCQSAEAREDDGLVALAPRLALSGVPNVLAMQGDITMESVARFIPRLFGELADHGQIDRAVAAARSDIRDRRDWWMPTLYTQSTSGVLWPARIMEGNTFDRWEAVISDLEEGHCVPVLGPGLAEPVFGSTRELAREWAERYEFPLAPYYRDDLAQVAQYLAYQHNPSYVLNQLRDYKARYIRRRFRDDLTPDLLTTPVKVGVVDRMMSYIGARQRATNPHDVYTSLAKLPVAIYVNANRDNLLFDALAQAGKKPHVRLCTWRSSGELSVPYGPPPEADYRPSIEEPLIFHVFGNYQYPESLVISEDDYFDFLTSVTRNEALANKSIPIEVSSALASSGLILLGFQVDDWDFRVLFGSIVRQPGSMMAKMHTRVAIQMNPSDERTIDPTRTHHYLRKFFQEQRTRVDLFWGSPEEFMTRLVNDYQEELVRDGAQETEVSGR